MKIYEFLYCSCIYESSYAPISLHRTKAGAYKAMKKHKVDTFMERYDKRYLYGKEYTKFPYDFAQGWTIGVQELCE
jgi:hypothetical protein